MPNFPGSVSALLLRVLCSLRRELPHARLSLQDASRRQLGYQTTSEKGHAHNARALDRGILLRTGNRTRRVASGKPTNTSGRTERVNQEWTTVSRRYVTT